MRARDEYHEIPAAVYAAATAWDPAVEIASFDLAAREAGVQVRRVLELGCATGRLLAGWAQRGVVAMGVELSERFVAHARASGLRVVQGDMRAFGRAALRDVAAEEQSAFEPFDLVYCSANTIRHLLTDDDLQAMGRCAADVLREDGLLIADLELGLRHLRSTVGAPQTWALADSAGRARAEWRMESLDAARRRCVVSYSFTHRRSVTPVDEFCEGCSGARSNEAGDARDATYTSRFALRAEDGVEFGDALTRDGRFALRAAYEVRWPDMLPRALDALQGRSLVVFQRVAARAE